MGLSARFHKTDRKTLEQMRVAIVQSARAGEGITRTAERLLDSGQPRVPIPKYVEELQDAARVAKQTGDVDVFEDVVKRFSKQVDRLGQGPQRAAGDLTMRSASQQLIKDLRRAKLDQVDTVVDRWVLERARHQARTVARTETVNAYRDSYVRSTKDQPWTKGYRWTLSGRHPVPDVCDVYASQNLHGLGPGVYPPGQLPATPHPNDLCSQIAVIDSQHFRRRLARRRGEREPSKPWEKGGFEDGHEWIRKQPERFQRELLGPTRKRYLEAGEKVLDETGKPLPVHVITGKPKPQRRPRPTQEASGLVREDRARMVEPFPPLPGKPSSS